MRIVAVVSMLALAAPLSSQERPPIIDMHLHASTASAYGPPPLALCVPMPELPLRDPRRPWGEHFLEWQKKAPCANPVRSPTSDSALLRETIVALERRNAIGVLSGRAVTRTTLGTPSS